MRIGKGGIKGGLVGGFKSKTMIVRVTKHTHRGIIGVSR